MLRVRVLGGLSLERDGVALAPPASRPARALLGWLALHPGTHARGPLAARLWPDVLDASARASLRTTLHALRGALGAGVVATRADVALAGDVWVDVRALRELAGAGRDREALALYRGELLAGLDDEWVLAARDRLRDEVVELLERLAVEAERGGDAAGAVRWTRKQVELDPLSEECNRALIERHWRAGERSSAVAVYERLRDRMRSELQVAPSAQTRALLARLRAQGDVADCEPAAPDLLALPALLARGRRSSFVGRTAELAQLDAALAAVRGGERRLVAVGGEPGIGKTRLVREFCRAAHARGTTVLFGRCPEEALVAFQPFAEALRPFGADVPAQLAAASRDAGAGDARWQLFEAIDALLSQTARERPAVLLLDDVHWADGPTLALLRHIVRSPEPAQLLLLATHRAAELRATHPLAVLLADLHRDELVDRVALGGLGGAEIGALAAGWVGAAATARLAHTLRDETGGNPFYVEELLRNLAEAGALRPLPQTVKDVIARRVERLGADAQAVLAAAAVTGDAFELELLEALPELAGMQPLTAVDAALAAQIVREDPSRPGRYEFAHALVRETLYEELSAARRARLHGAIAAAIAALHGDRRLAERAHHELAARGARGVELALRAAGEANATLAHEEAAAWYERALAAGPQDDRAAILLALGAARQRAGAGPAARDAFAAAAAVARERGDAELLGRAALGFSGFGVSIIGIDEAAVALLREALAVLPDAGALTARIVARLAIETYYVSLPAERKGLGDRAVRLARASGDERALFDALNARHVALWSAAFLGEREQTADEMIALGERIGDPERVLQGRNWRVLGLAERGDIAAMQREIERHEALADELRVPAFQWWGPLWRSTIAIIEGHYADAERLVAEVAAIGRRAQDDNAVLMAYVQTYNLAVERERFDLVDEAALERQLGEPAEAAYRCGFAWVLAAQGRAEEARTMLDWVAQDGFARLPDDMNRVAALCELAHASMLLGDRRHAAGIYERLAPYADRNAINARAAAGYGSVSLHLALVAGEDRAATHFEDALAHNERMGARPWLARTQLLYARFLHARGDGARCGALLDRALHAATELDLEPLAARVRAARARVAA